MQAISRDELKEKMDSNSDLTVVEVLDTDRYNTYHLPGAINVPFNSGFDQAIQSSVPDKSKEVVVYCADSECPASAKAGQRMEQLGYENVYDYEGGKLDWKEAGMPVQT